MKQEELQKYADKLAQEYFPNEHNIWARENIEAICASAACMRMAHIVAKHVEQKLIEKACGWWEQRQEDYDLRDAWSGDCVSFKSVIMEFREEMEG